MGAPGLYGVRVSELDQWRTVGKTLGLISGRAHKKGHEQRKSHNNGADEVPLKTERFTLLKRLQKHPFFLDAMLF